MAKLKMSVDSGKKRRLFRKRGIEAKRGRAQEEQRRELEKRERARSRNERIFALLTGAWDRAMSTKQLQWVDSTAFGHAYLANVAVRTEVSLVFQILLNSAIAATNIVAGVRSGSVWFGILGAYFLALVLLRLMLLRDILLNRPRKTKMRDLPYFTGLEPNGVPESFEDQRVSWTAHGRCAWLMLWLNAAMAFVYHLIVDDGYHYEYAGAFIFVQALYAGWLLLWSLGMFIWYRKAVTNPTLEATRDVNLVNALMAQMGFLTAVVYRFGDEWGWSAWFMRVAGAVIVIAALAITVTMIMKSRKHADSVSLRIRRR